MSDKQHEPVSDELFDTAQEIHIIYVHHKQCFSLQGGECDCIPTETRLLK